ncbi:hypothetical protein [Oscillibacter sp.]|uniref:hypothetical protein n=1 Tax=Oscillibacter sp. TaxID=1945593 RepID=UPI002D7EC91C|nr:hypothetical protein [Oscillibacter sp.]
MLPKDWSSFDYIWYDVILPVSQTVMDECDPDFVEHCGLYPRSSEEWKPALHEEYCRLRAQLKDICYGPSNHRAPDELLDGRKIAAVLCAALISTKGFQFNLNKALEYAERKNPGPYRDRVWFNRWAVGNVYVNYKLAYYASLQLVYLTLMRDLLVNAGLQESDSGVRPLEHPTPQELKERDESRLLARALNRMGHLAPYVRRQPSRGDSFDVNIIIGLARTDMSNQNLDMFLFAMQLYQIEEHTVDILRRSLPKD